MRLVTTTSPYYKTFTYVCLRPDQRTWTTTDFLEDQMAIEEDVMYEPDTEAKYLDVFLKKNK